jgi:hypothetical protein
LLRATTTTSSPTVDELAGFDAVVVVDVEEVAQRVADLGTVARTGLDRLGGLVPGEIRREQLLATLKSPRAQPSCTARTVSTFSRDIARPYLAMAVA